MKPADGWKIGDFWFYIKSMIFVRVNCLKEVPCSTCTRYVTSRSHCVIHVCTILVFSEGVSCQWIFSVKTMRYLDEDFASFYSSPKTQDVFQFVTTAVEEDCGAVRESQHLTRVWHHCTLQKCIIRACLLMSNAEFLFYL